MKGLEVTVDDFRFMTKGSEIRVKDLGFRV